MTNEEKLRKIKQLAKALDGWVTSRQGSARIKRALLKSDQMRRRFEKASRIDGSILREPLTS